MKQPCRGCVTWRRRGFDEAQRMLEDMPSAHAPRDADGWLRRSILAHKAMLYLATGDPGRALSTYQELTLLGFTQPSERVEYGLGHSRALLAHGRPQQAVAHRGQRIAPGTALAGHRPGEAPCRGPRRYTRTVSRIRGRSRRGGHGV
jgi:hypothetical protein